jgi:hypothetical protein
MTENTQEQAMPPPMSLMERSRKAIQIASGKWEIMFVVFILFKMVNSKTAISWELIQLLAKLLKHNRNDNQ